MEVENLLEPNRVILRNPENIITHGSCSDPNTSTTVFFIGKIRTYKVDDLITFEDMDVLLKWNHQHGNGSVEGFGHYRFCGQGDFRYHIYPQDGAITGFKSHSSKSIQWQNMLAVYPQLEGGHTIMLWHEIEYKLQLSSSLLLAESKWYTFWEKGQTWSFFKCRKGAQTFFNLPGFGGFPRKDAMLELSNFEGVTNKDGSFILQVLSFRVDVVSFLRLVLRKKILADLNQLIPLAELESVIKVLGNVSK